VRFWDALKWVKASVCCHAGIVIVHDFIMLMSVLLENNHWLGCQTVLHMYGVLCVVLYGTLQVPLTL